MPIIQFTTADVLRAKLLDPGYYSFKIVKIEGPKENANKDGFNYFVFFELIDEGEGFDGKQIKHTFSNKAISMMLPLVQAVRGGEKIEPKDFVFDTDELSNTKVDGKVTQETYEGQLNNKLEVWFPYKSIVGKALAF